MIRLDTYLNEAVRTGKKYKNIPFPKSPDDKNGLIRWLELHYFENITDPDNTIMFSDQDDYSKPTYQLGKYDGDPNHEWIMVGDGKGTIYFIRTTAKSNYQNRTDMSVKSYGKWKSIHCTFADIQNSLENLVK